MTKKAAIALLATLAAAVAVLLLLRPQRQPRAHRASGPIVRSRETAPLQGLPVSPAPPPPPELTRVTLFFPNQADGLLRPEERDVKKPSDAVMFVREIIAELCAGPKAPELAPVFPEKLSLRNAFVPGSGLVVVDLNVDAEWVHSCGSEEESAAVASIVDSLLQNIAQTDRVRILVNGNTVETLAGHVDLSRPLPAMKEAIGFDAVAASTSTAVPDGAKK